MSGPANGRRELVLALAGCVLGAGVTLFAADRPWVHARAVQGSLQVPLSVRGGSLTAAVPAFAVVGLAGALGLLATRGVGRRITGLVILAAGLGATQNAAANLRPTSGDLAERAGAALGTASGAATAVSHTAWGVLAMIGAAVFTLAGAAATVRGPRWPGMGARYETPVVPTPNATSTDDSALEQWRALDRGEDPTV
jgi:uncharacterized membrane protein (TIGR02234 family)